MITLLVVMFCAFRIAGQCSRLEEQADVIEKINQTDNKSERKLKGDI